MSHKDPPLPSSYQFLKDQQMDGDNNQMNRLEFPQKKSIPSAQLRSGEVPSFSSTLSHH